jgi:acetolactate synthase-1/3 small subunit
MNNSTKSNVVLYDMARHKRTIRRHILVAFVQNNPGVLNRVSSLFRRRRFNIESIIAGHTEKPEITRITIVVDADKVNTEQAKLQLFKLIEVVKILELKEADSIVRENALIKVASTKASRSELIQITDIYKAKIADVQQGSMTIELCDKPDTLDAFIELMKPFGIIELVRTGLAAMQRS